MTTSCTDNTHPYYSQVSELESEKIVGFFTENPSRMTHVSLGELLDFNSFGGMNYVVWRMGRKDLVNLIDQWMKAQKPKVNIARIPGKIKGTFTLEEKSREYEYTWNRFHNLFEEKLPFVCNDVCPANNLHMETVQDHQGRTRCANSSCYSIISEEGVNLPLETVFSRLEVSYAFSGQIDDFSIFPFSGFTLANYVEAWFNQEGEKRLFNPSDRVDSFRVFSDFAPVAD